jgi:glycerol-3-phosphate dehydrogenase
VIERDFKAAARSSYDLVIVGGGVYGIALALEAARRGLEPLLVERRDYGGETSWNSLRIAHGGLRSLQTLDLRRFREMVEERRWWLQHFPDLVEPLPCLMPLYGPGLRRPAVLRLALATSDLLSWRRNRGVRSDRALPRGQVLGVEETLALCDRLDRSGLLGGALWYDGLILDSQRLLLQMLHWATASGAGALNYVEASGLVVRNGRVAGVKLRDVVSGQVLDVETKTVVNCAGPWCREVAESFDKDLPELFQLSLAFNVLVDRPPLSEAALAVVPRARGGRTYFLVPWKGKILAGTYHVGWSRSREEGEVDDDLVARFLGDLNEALPGLGLRLQDAVRVFWGFLPARRAGSAELVTREVVRHHSDKGGPLGLFSVSGVKYTTARRVAETTLRRVEAWRKQPLTAPREDLPPSVPSPPSWKEFEILLREDENAARAELHRLVAEESVLSPEDLVLRRTDWGMDPSRAQSRAALVAPLLPGDLPRVEPDA